MSTSRYGPSRQPQHSRVSSARGRLEGNLADSGPLGMVAAPPMSFDEMRTSLSRQGQRLPGANYLRRRSASGPMVKTVRRNKPTEEWSTHLRETIDPGNSHYGFEFHAEGSRNRPHPSEDFLRWRLPANKSVGSGRMTRTTQTLRRQTKEGFYLDYSTTMMSNDGDGETEVLTKVQNLPYDPANYVEAARRELKYNPPIPPQYIFEHYGYRPEDDNEDDDERAHLHQPTRTTDQEAHESSSDDDDSDEKQGDQLKVGKPEIVLVPEKKLRAWLKPSACAKGPSLKKPGNKLVRIEVDEPGIRAHTPHISTRKIEQAPRKSALKRPPTPHRISLKKPTGKVLSHQWAVPRENAGAGESHLKAKSTRIMGGHHAGCTQSSRCEHCQRREFEDFYKSFASLTDIGKKQLLASLPHNPAPEVMRYQRRDSMDPTENTSSAFGQTRPRHIGQFTIAPDWSSEITSKTFRHRPRTSYNILTPSV
eukprot:scpid34768/ scgid29772/ 